MALDRLQDLSLAFAANSVDIAEDIVSAPDFDPNCPDRRGLPPLFLACAYGRYAMVKLLVDRRADIHFKLRGTGVTPLHVAASNGFPDIVELLIGLGVDFVTRDSAGSTALDYAEISPQLLESSNIPQDLIDRGDEKLIQLRHQCVRVLGQT